MLLAALIIIIQWFIYIVSLIQGTLQCITFTHSHTDGGGNHARHQPAHREQLGVQSLAQGHIDSNSGGPNFEHCSKTVSAADD